LILNGRIERLERVFPSPGPEMATMLFLDGNQQPLGVLTSSGALRNDPEAFTLPRCPWFQTLVGINPWEV